MKIKVSSSAPMAEGISSDTDNRSSQGDTGAARSAQSSQGSQPLQQLAEVTLVGHSGTRFASPDQSSLPRSSSHIRAPELHEPSTGRWPNDGNHRSLAPVRGVSAHTPVLVGQSDGEYAGESQRTEGGQRIQQSNGLEDELPNDSISERHVNLQSKIEGTESIQGLCKKLCYTHNTDSIGLLGILSSQMIATVERNVNFRYGVDSRYAGGVTLVMKDGFENRLSGAVKTDLYGQSEILLGKKSAKNSPTSTLFDVVSQNADFRVRQMERMGGRLRSIRGAKNSRESMKANSSLSLVNPQVRAPWRDNKITHEDVDLILVASCVDEEINSPEFKDTLRQSFSAFSSKLERTPGDGSETLVRRDVASKLNGSVAMERYRKLKAMGKIKIVEVDSDNLFSHRAGRLAKRGSRELNAIEKAADQGLEISPKYFSETMNNSPAALSMDALTEFERAYFSHLLKKGAIEE